jgi:preprotein translocase subunit SecF
MTIGGMTKRTALFYTSAGFLVAAAMFALWGHDVWQKLAVLWMVFGLIAGAGSWFAGLPQSEDPATEEWAEAIK